MTEFIDLFCDTLDTKYLAKLPKEYQFIFLKYSVFALTKKNTNKKIAIMEKHNSAKSLAAALQELVEGS